MPSNSPMNNVNCEDPRFAVLPMRPGKIIAVHLSYRSRAEQRGRIPAHPSYFFKPSSSVAPSGASITRPAGTELLAFEGEIAVIIGSVTRRVSREHAWDQVGWVTAANDFGLYDWRSQDRGSNVRSKGGDGYTPLGPALLDAREIDPINLQLQTWVNGEIVQDDTTSNMIFPMTQLIADLSQHSTLEVGDIILIGTPAGSTVVTPGDVVEVAVTDTASGATTGRLVTTVVAGEDAYDPELGDMPGFDQAQCEAAYGSTSARNIPPLLDPQLKELLMAVPTATLSSQLRRRGLNNVVLDGVYAMPNSGKVVGVAKTLRFVPNREDLFARDGGGYNAQKRAFDALRPGEVMVIAARNEKGAGTLGDILALRAQANGAAGIITDGPVRDFAAVDEIDIPVYSSGAHPAVLGRKNVPCDYDLTISCGGATIEPGDIIVGDADGVIVIPPGLAQEVATDALAQEESDAWIAERVKDGNRLEGLFPMNDQWKARYANREAPGSPS